MIIPLSGKCALVHVVRQTVVSGMTNAISSEVRMTGVPYTTGLAQMIDGYVFTHWSISTKQEFVDRDEWGRACDEVGFVLYEDTVLSAHYLPLSEDADRDGIPDGYELYYYGDLSQDGESDTDEDGRPFREELEIGTSPLNAEDERDGYVRIVDGGICVYNPRGYKSITIMSRPEGELLTTSIEYLRPDTWVNVAAFSPQTSKFAYWERNGVRMCDEWGRAIDGCGFMMSTNDECFVAVLADDETARMKLYWYGTTDIGMDSDTDGDGVAFADELLRGTSPLEFDEDVQGPVRTADGALLQYNPYNKHPYLVRSEPEGVLFATISNYVSTGLFVESPRCDGLSSVFAFWTLNGEEVRDEWGRAMDVTSFQMPTVAVELVAHVISNATKRAKYYWYGTFDVSMDSDTDDDGVVFAAELVNGTDPIIADEFVQGPIAHADSQFHEANLQPYERVDGLVADGRYVLLADFGGAVTPTLADVNGDGKLDIVVEVEGGETVVYLGCGGEGNPEFKKVIWQGAWAPALAAAKPRSLEGLEFDVKPPEDALSWSFADVDGDGVEDLLVSDNEGRIWYYKGLKDENDTKDEKDESDQSFTSLLSFKSFVLQHKVWGGSFAGFANGLRIAAVDWDDDGDLDCLAGTAEGKLMLLRDPKVGRPTNLKALVGVDNVWLIWDPNQQSRIRGYRVYRAGAKDEKDERDEKDWSLLSLPSLVSFGLSTTLPRYRDYPPEIADFDYKVTSVSKHYVSGNSTPIESESMPTEAVRASMGKVKFLWSDAAAFVGDEVRVKLGVENSLNLSGKGLSLSIAYEANDLQPVRVETSGLTEGVTLADEPANGQWMVTASDGAVAAGGGTFVTFVFKGLQASTGDVSLVSAMLKSSGGATITPVLPEKDACVEIWARQPETPTDPRYVGPYGKWDMNGDGWLTWEDRQLMSELMQGGPKKKYTPEQLRAGDDNGNGELDNHDFQQMKADFDALGIKNKEGTEVEVEK